MFWISRFKSGDIDDPAYRDSLVDIFFNAIFLYDDKIVITFNWKDGTKTVSLAELEDVMDSAEDDTEASNCNRLECSHLDDSPLPNCGKSELKYSPVVPVGMCSDLFIL